MHSTEVKAWSLAVAVAAVCLNGPGSCSSRGSTCTTARRHQNTDKIIGTEKSQRKSTLILSTDHAAG